MKAKLNHKMKFICISRYRVALAAVGLLMTLAVVGCSQPPAPPPAAPPPAATVTQTPAERGEMLVTVGLCHDCHTPKKLGPKGPEPDMDRMLSGHPEGSVIDPPFKPAAGSPWIIATNDQLTAWSGPWGVSFSANLTPDTVTGLRSGVWSEELFIEALRTGKHVGTARDILPPMPWPFIGQYSDDDLKAIWAYLGTIPAIRNQVPDPIPPAASPKK